MLAETKTFHIISWNVASWSTTITKIKLHHGSLKNWLEQHQVDILCIQEVKVNVNDITLRSRELGATEDHDYDTFWACPIKSIQHSCKTAQGLGLNGVATFCRKGVTCSTTTSVFECSSLDNEGRCILSDHGSFVIFNIYVPNSGDKYCRYPFKMKFLHSLQVAVQKQRVNGKKILLVGDFNIAPRTVDVCRQHRTINVEELLKINVIDLEKYYRNPTTDTEDESFFLAGYFSISLNRFLNNSELRYLIESVLFVQSVWPSILTSLSSLVIEINSSAMDSKFKLTVVRSYDLKKVKLNHFGSEHNSYSLARQSVVDESSGTGWLLREAGRLPLEELREAVKQLAPPLQHHAAFVPSAKTAALASLTALHWDVLADVLGLPCHAQSSIDWFYKFLKEEDLVDTYLWSTGQDRAAETQHGRFTCWDQSKNKRYVNAGSRIDFMLASRDWWEEVAGPPPPPPEPAVAAAVGVLTAAQDMLRCNLSLVTADGLFRPALPGGGGIPTAAAAAYQRQFQPPVTGMVYTPPDFSDHAAVSAVLRLNPSPLPLARDAATRRSQPHRQQAAITGYFQKQPSQSDQSGPQKKRAPESRHLQGIEKYLKAV